MELSNSTIWALLTCCTCLFVSCKKKDINGCTDTDAVNYAYEANTEDGSCLYSGEISFWYDNQTRDSLLSNALGAVIPYVNDSSMINVYPQFISWTQEPDCHTNAIRVNVDLGHQKSKFVKFSICYDNLANVAIQDSVMVSNQGCNLYKIVWM